MLLNACHPGKSSLSSVGGGGHTDFFKKKISNKSKICTHSEFTLLLGGGGDLSAITRFPLFSEGWNAFSSFIF